MLRRTRFQGAVHIPQSLCFKGFSGSSLRREKRRCGVSI